MLPPAPAMAPRFPPLPSPLTRFFGRTDEIDRVGALLRRPDVRLVTLTGPGGVGKTRLALETARHLSGFFQSAVLFVGLASLSDGDRVLDALADALRLPLTPGPAPGEQVAAALGRQPTLLILDNLEQIAESAGPLVESLLTRAPDLTCLVTSRQRLDIPGEREFSLFPLPAPLAAQSQAVSLSDFPSVQLFVDRAQAGLPDFQITPRNAPAVAALCERLEGIPLALELTAGWAQTLTPAQMLERLEDQFPLLVSHREGPVLRRRTLPDAVEWSYCLLSPDLQRFFVQLSVFRGGWDLEAAQSVCEEPQALEMLSHLRARSLLVTTEEGGALRFRMLEGLREFAGERRAEDSEVCARLARRHAHYFLQLAGEAKAALDGPDQLRWLDCLDTEHGNLRAALDWCQADPTGADAGIQLAFLLGRPWYMRGHWRDLRQALEALLARVDASAAARATAFSELGDVNGYLDDMRASDEAYSQSLILYERLEDWRSAARCLRSLGRLAQNRGDYQASRSYFERSLCLLRSVGSDPDVADVLHNLGRLIQVQGDTETACALYRESLSLARQSGDAAGAAVLTDLAEIAVSANRHDEARALLEERLLILRRLGNWRGIGNTLLNLSRLAQTQGETARAVPLVEEGLSVYRVLGYQQALADALDHLSEVASSLGDQPRAEAALQERQKIQQRLAGAVRGPRGLPE